MQKLKKYKIVAVILAVIIIPLVYSFFYLDAFWDPYSKLENLPVAVVNQDSGATINGRDKNIGKEITGKLENDNTLKWVVTDDADAKDGLNGRRYYAAVYIPPEFSKNISTAGDIEKIKGTLNYSVNEKRNYLASQVLSRVTLEFKDKISEEVSEEIMDTLFQQIKDIPSDLKELDGGLKKLDDGADTIYLKTGELIAGQKQFNTGLYDLNKGIKSARASSGKLSDGARKLRDGAGVFYEKLNAGAQTIPGLVKGVSSFSQGLTSVNESLTKLSTGTAQLASSSSGLKNGMESYGKNLQAFSSGLNNYVESVNKSADAQAGIAAMLRQYMSAHPEALNDQNMQAIVKALQAGQQAPEQIKQAGAALTLSGEKLCEGASGLTQGADSLNAGLGRLSDSFSQISAGAEKLHASYGRIDSAITVVSENVSSAAASSKELYEGASRLQAGASELASGMAEAAGGSGHLYSGAVKLYDGEEKLYAGMGELTSGISKAHQDVSGSLSGADSQLDGIDGLKEYIAGPILLKEQKVNGIPDYGTAFTPYFVSLSLWVGALMMFFAIYLDPDVRFRRLSENSRGFLRFAGYSLIGMAQAVVLDIAILNGLHLQVKNTVLFVLASIIISLSFTSIMRFLLVQLRDVGKFTAILLLILQLTSCGGTFPMELVPNFFNAINPFMPMTYSVNALKEVISGIDYGYLAQNLLVLGCTGLAFLILNMIVSKLRMGKLLADSKEADEVSGPDRALPKESFSEM
ncbi:ABC-2 family transporter protein [Ruminiclostridium hungatei]|uniref:ABC-2 family transporter protein n=1 Tax=Ruminiclostridium hungatei TaxID=48256 RepID=A0A1V4SJ19_RUMHU|nr:YhgE/Pip domain-containing protein [Ruminiclostridium hungatei]OPX43506.1 ABC-2 family transporter protein [Ruminiclostridium hungatei]